MVVSFIEQHYYLMAQTLLIFMEESQLLKFLASLENKLLCKVRDFSPISQTDWKDICNYLAFV